MSGILEQLGAERRADVVRDETQVPLAGLREAALLAPAVAGRMYQALKAPGLSVIAEIKRASPSKGPIARIPDPAALARAYAAGGARAISVLTEPRHFHGTLDDLAAVAKSVAAPTLRKDFLVHPRQIWEARLAGAGAVLLIAALLGDDLASMHDEAGRAGLDALVEVHDEAGLDYALEAGATIIGVNHRDLRTFAMDMDRFARLRPRMPAAVAAVAESGIRTPEDARRMADAGADAILVGEHLASAADPAAALRSLLGGA